MTQQTSAKGFLGQMLSVFKWELKKNKTALIIYGVLAAFFTIMIYALCATIGKNEGLKTFQYIATGVIFLLTSVYTIVYTIKIFAYLHNKRQADMFMQLPVKSEAMFLSKAVSAFALSAVPALFFIGIICIITLATSGLSGTTVAEETLMFFLKIPLGALACISFYGLLAVCFGRSFVTAASFVIFNFAYPISATLVKSMIDSFFLGIPPYVGSSSFLLRAFNPLAAYDGVNVIYWLIFTAGCLVLGSFLVSRRKNELAQTAYIYPLPIHAVKLLASFIVGMGLGMVFGALNVLDASYGGFVFGFLLGSSTAFVIAHVIFFLGFKRFAKSLIYYGVMCVLALAFAAVCQFASPAYREFTPKAEDVKSAGYVSLKDLDSHDAENAPSIARNAAGDFTDKEDIESIIKEHSLTVDRSSNNYYETAFLYSDPVATDISNRANYYAAALKRTFFNIGDYGISNDGFCVAYTMKDGSVKTRVYSAGDWFISPYYTYEDADICATAKYFDKYNVVNRADVSELKNFKLCTPDNGMALTVKDKDGETADKIKGKIIEAYKADYRENPVKINTNNYSATCISFNYGKNRFFDYAESTFGGSLYSAMMNSEFENYGADFLLNQYSLPVPSKFERTRKVLKDYGMIDDMGVINKNSGFPVETDEYDDYYMGYDGYDYEPYNTVFVGDIEWSCPEAWTNNYGGGYETYTDGDDKLMMFQSYADIKAGKFEEEKNSPYAESFKVVEVVSKEDCDAGDCICGKAKITTDNGKTTETLRYIQLICDTHNLTYFFTPEVDEETYKYITENLFCYESY